MARYIDADKLKSEFNIGFGGVSHAVIANRIIDSIPTADVAEVKHGEWKHKRATIDGEHYFCCSECGREVSVNIYDNPSVTRFYPYCHCGAKMDERRDT